MKKDCRGTFDEDYALLRLSVEAGIDEDLQETPSNWFELGKAAVHAPHTTSLPKPVAGQAAQPSAKTPDFANLKPNLAMPFIDSQNTNEARDLAAKARTLEELETFLKSFEGCALKKTATNTVFADGNSKSGLMLIGEAPGAEEDRQGKPFVGPAGQLLDRMMAAIGLTREAFYITNVCFWRPPGNRKPSEAEWAACRPFVTRHIELVQPRVIFLLGGSAAQQVLNRPEGITRLRGHWNEWANPAGRPIPTLATFHPAYLLRQPAAKRESWRDLIRLRKMLDQSVT